MGRGTVWHTRVVEWVSLHRWLAIQPVSKTGLAQQRVLQLQISILALLTGMFLLHRSYQQLTVQIGHYFTPQPLHRRLCYWCTWESARLQLVCTLMSCTAPANIFRSRRMGLGRLGLPLSAMVYSTVQTTNCWRFITREASF